MEIYVQSCGLAQNQDYYWQNPITQTREVPYFLGKSLIFKNLQTGEKGILTDFYNSEYPSLILLELETEKLGILLTGLKAIKRTKIYRRRIRNSLALIAENQQENQEIENIFEVARYHGELLQEIMDYVVDFDAKLGFIVSLNQLKEKLNHIENDALSLKKSQDQTQLSLKPQRVKLIKKAERSQEKYLTVILPLVVICIAIFVSFMLLPRPNGDENEDKGSKIELERFPIPQEIPIFIPEKLSEPDPPQRVLTKEMSEDLTFKSIRILFQEDQEAEVPFFIFIKGYVTT